MAGYVPTTCGERKEMLDYLGIPSVDELFSSIPPEVPRTEIDLPRGVCELEALRDMTGLSKRNRRFDQVFRGAGAYRHYIPSIVDAVSSKESLVTTYTPYQAEISQGVLQSIFEYQTQVCELTGMDVSNASVYDGASAAAEALLMCVGRTRTSVVLSGTTDPQVVDVVRSYCASRGVRVEVVAPLADLSSDVEALRRALGADTAALYVQSPNYYGVIEDMDELVGLAHDAGAKMVMGFNPIALGILRSPGELGCDVAVGEGQPLGLPLGFGGPYLGIMAATGKLMRKLPGRIVGQTTDARGRRAFVLTLQAREQHIRREKASSNICSNEALCALRASAYLASLGPEGLARVAQGCAAHAHYLAERLAGLTGFTRVGERPFFHEFVTTSPLPPTELEGLLADRGILGGLPVRLPAGGEGLLWCCTELNAKGDIDALVRVLREVASR